MSFLQSAYSLKSRLHISGIPTPALIGAGILLVAALVGVAAGFVSCAESESAYEVVSSEEQARQHFGESGQNPASEEDSEVASSQEGAAQGSPSVSPPLAVHVSGAVVSAGVYEVEEGSRVRDVVEAAGGFSSDAAQSSVNLARKVSDGEQIVILTTEEFQASSSGALTASSSDAAAAAPSGSTGLVNINTAGLEALDSLPGVGPATAQAILDEREANGPFASIEDIQRVSGIGEKKFEKLKASICV